MKKNIIFLIFIVFFTIKTDQSFSQASKDSIQITATDNYYKIPKADFDNILNNRIENEVSNKLEFWIKRFALLFTLLGAFGVWQVKQIFKSSVNEVTDNNNQRFSIEIKDVKAKIDEQRIEIKDDIKEINTTIDKRYEEFRSITNEANKATTKIEVDRIKADPTLGSDEKIKKLEEKLKIIIGYNDNEFASEVIDILGVEYFLSNSEKLIEIIEEYSKSPIKLWSKTYLNGGIFQYFNYEEHYLDSYKQSCLKYCDKAIELFPTYGDAYVIKVSVFALDYEKKTNEKEKEIYKNLIGDILESVQNSSEYMCNCVMLSVKNRAINNAPNIGNFQSRVETIMKLFPQAYEKINEKSNEYDLKYPQNFA